MNLDRELFVMKLYDSGLTPYKIEKETGISVYEIKNILSANGILHLREVDKTAETIEKIRSLEGSLREMYNNGVKTADIAKEIGVSTSTANIYLTVIGCGKTYTEEEIRQVIDAYNTFKTSTEAYRHINMSSRTYNVILLKARYEGRLQVRDKVNDISEEQLEECINLFREGYSIGYLSRKTGVYKITLPLLIKSKIGEEGYRDIISNHCKLNHIVKMRTDGYSLDDIVKKKETSLEYVKAVLSNAIEQCENNIDRLKIATGETDDKKLEAMYKNINTLLKGIKQNKEINITKEKLQSIIKIVRFSKIIPKEDIKLLMEYRDSR